MAKTMVSWQAFPSLPPRAPLALLSHLKLPFPSLSNACHAGYGLWGKKSQRDLGEGMLGMLVQCTKDLYAVFTVEALMRCLQSRRVFLYVPITDYSKIRKNRTHTLFPSRRLKQYVCPPVELRSVPLKVNPSR